MILGFCILMGLIIAAVVLKEIALPKILWKLDEKAIANAPEIKTEDRNEKHKKFESYIHGLMHENEEGDKVLDVILKAMRKEARECGSYYKEVHKEDFKEEPFLEAYEFDALEVDVELQAETFEGEPAVKVLIVDGDKRHGAGYLPKEDADYIQYLMRTYDYTAVLECEGGKVKRIVYEDEDGNEYPSGKIEIEEEEYFPKVVIEYDKDDEEEDEKAKL